MVTCNQRSRRAEPADGDELEPAEAPEPVVPPPHLHLRGSVEDARVAQRAAGDPGARDPAERLMPGMQASSSEEAVIGGRVVVAVVVFAIVVDFVVVDVCFVDVVDVVDVVDAVALAAALCGMIVKITSSRVQPPERSAVVSDRPPARRARTAGITSDEPVRCMRTLPSSCELVATTSPPMANLLQPPARNRAVAGAKNRVDVRIPRVCSDGGNDCNRRSRPGCFGERRACSMGACSAR